MINLIDYLLLFIVIAVLSNSGYLTIIYLGLSILVSLLWCGIYCYRKKKNNLESTKYEFDMNIYLVIVAIIMVNLVHKLAFINLIFGFSYLSLFVINMIRFISKKDSSENKPIIKTAYLFDIYAVLYLAGLIVEIISHEF